MQNTATHEQKKKDHFPQVFDVKFFFVRMPLMILAKRSLFSEEEQKGEAIVTTSLVQEGLAPLRLGIEPRSPT